MDSKSKISKQNDKLRQSLGLINESNEIGNDTTNQMKINNEKTKELAKKTGEINDKTNKSKSTLDVMMSFWRNL
jgi:hypothetical protein